MASGGTGGHIFPAISLADEFKRRNRDWEIVFIGSVKGVDEKVLPERGYRLEMLDVESLRGKRGRKRIRSLSKLFRSTLKAVRLLRRLKPDGVIGFGSYSSAPVILAAKLLRLRTAILEQNVLPGMTNRFLGKVVDRIYTTFEDTAEYFTGRSVLLTGNPVRREIVNSAGSDVSSFKSAGFFTILVFGGSQGAKAINAAFLDGIEFLTDIIGSIKIIHQTGVTGYEDVITAYRRKGLISNGNQSEMIEVFKFIDDMSSAYSAADLVICRSGATSIAEITAFGLPSILIPYPFAVDNHQEINAKALSNREAAILIKQEGLTGRVLADTVRRFYEDSYLLNKMKAAAKALGKPEAVEMIADDYIELFKPMVVSKSYV